MAAHKKTIIIIALGIFSSLNILAQQQTANTAATTKPATATTPEATDSTTATTQEPPPDQIIETKQTKEVDSKGNEQSVTTLEYF
jgi:hypothetical protein